MSFAIVDSRASSGNVATSATMTATTATISNNTTTQLTT